MTVRLVYFAWVREKLGRAEEFTVLPPEVRTVADVVAWQAARGAEYADVFAQRGVVRVAVDQMHADAGMDVSRAREIAFFPPVTGG